MLHLHDLDPGTNRDFFCLVFFFWPQKQAKRHYSKKEIIIVTT